MDSVLQRDQSIRAGKVALQVQATAVKPEYLSSISWTHKVEGEK